jgi:hypothetical protein
LFSLSLTKEIYAAAVFNNIDQRLLQELADVLIENAYKMEVTRNERLFEECFRHSG